ncbi:MAG: hypothetical protein J4F39_13825 [Candidatus Latescibacteria bacterium]|nr:hypothetical protein [Candidatus Latescibacterota bacterium]
MSVSSLVSNLEENISRLPLNEQLLLIERISNRIHKGISGETDMDSLLRKMAADPEIQSELKAIDREFSTAYQGGLND